MKFKYRKIPIVEYPSSAITDKKIPIIPIFVKYGRKVKRHYMLIDSGADNCILHSNIGKELGIDIKKGKETKFYGINKKEYSVGYKHNVNFIVGDSIIRKIPVIFSEFITTETFGIFGQVGFFNKFKITFDYKKGDIEIK